MEMLKGKVQDPGFPDTEVTYIKTDDGQTYFFIENGNLKNGNYIATPVLKEGIGHAPYTSLGLVTQNGEVLIPFENKNIQALSNDLLLVERNVPVTESVVEALKKQNDPLSAGELIESANTIKEQIKSVMGLNGSFVFDNQFSEAALYTTEGVNLANNYFSFIGAKDGAYYMSTNVVGSPISKYDPYAYSMQSDPDQKELPEQENSEQSVPEQDVESPENVDDTTPLVPELNIQTPLEDNTSDSAQQEVGLPTIDSEKTEGTPSDDPTDVEPANLNIPLFAQQNLDEGQEIPWNNPVDEVANVDQPEVTNVEQPEIDNNTESVSPELNISLPTTEGDDSANEIENESSEEVTNYTEVESEQSDEQPAEIPTDVNYEISQEEPDEVENPNDDSDVDAGTSKVEQPKEEDFDETLSNPVIVNATNTIRKLLEENRKQRQILDQHESEVDALTSSNEILKSDNDSKSKEIISLRNSMNKYRKDNSELLRNNKRLSSINAHQEEMIKNLKMQNATLKEQVAGITALNNAVAEANNLFSTDDVENEVTADYSYLDEDAEEDSYQYTKTAE